MWRIIACLTLAACAENTNNSQDMAAGVDLAEAPDLRTPPNVCGRVVDEAGAPKANERAQLCSTKLCLTNKTGSDGRLCFAARDPGEYHFRFFGDPMLSFADVFFPFPLGNEVTQPGFSAQLGDNLIAPTVTETRVIDAAAGGTLTFANGAKLEVPPGSITLPELAGSGPVAIVNVPAARVAPQLLASHTGTAESVWVMVPFGALLDKAGGKEGKLTLPNPTNLANGTQVEIALANFDTGRLEPHAQGAVQGGVIVTQAGQGMGALGWIALYRK